MQRRTLIIIAITTIITIASLFGGWLFYIGVIQKNLDETSSGRGLNNENIGGFPVGSAYNNIVETIGNIFSGENSLETASEGKPSPRIWLAGAAPTAGIQWVKTEGEKGLALRFIDTASGNIFDAYPNTSTVTRKTNTLKPRIKEASWVGEDALVARYIDSQGIESFLGEIIAATTTNSTTETALGSLEGENLPRGILSVATNKSGEIFYISPYNDGVAGYLMKNISSKPTRIWTSPLSGWRSSWTGNSILITQRPSFGVIGSSYKLSETGSITPVLGNIPGLITKGSLSGEYVLYSSSDETSAASLGIYNTETSPVTTPPFKTLAEKCTWSTFESSTVYCAVPRTIPSNTEIPDAWYRGEISFSDTIWKFNTKTGSVSLIYDPTINSLSLDIINLVASEEDEYLGFIDKTSGSTWVLRIEK